MSRSKSYAPNVANLTASWQDRMHRWVWALVDASLWGLAMYGASLLRYDFHQQPVFVRATLWFALFTAAVNMLVGALIGPYAVGHQRGSFEETTDVARTVLVTSGIVFAATLFFDPIRIPRSIPVIAGALALTGMFAVRFVVRTMNVRRATQTGQRRVILFGAGEAGRRLLRSMIREADSGFTPVALLDDDKSKARLRVEGVRVRGTRTAMGTVAQRYDAETLVIALPNADAALIRDLSRKAADVGLEVLVLPPLRDIMGGRPSVGDLRDVDLHDLLGRRAVSLDTSLIADQIAGRSVLVTGAGGSIGSELCRQIARFGPAKLYLLDRDESGLQGTQLSLSGHGLLDSDEVILADIRDLNTMRSVFADTSPDLVFHAAALKHLPLLERYPLEAWKTNVLGTLNVLQAATEVGVGTFVNISTDKAVEPTCVLGYSKRVTERLTAAFAAAQPGRYVSVRFGNVLGSRGSVIHAFGAQIDAGGPVTVTHPDVERFFMLIPEACQLVLEAASIGSDGEVMVLNMGEQVQIIEVAKTLIRLSRRTGIEIIYTGLRHGEKLGEELFSKNEIRRSTSNDLVSSVDVPPLDAHIVWQSRPGTHQDAIRWMQDQTVGLVGSHL